MKNSTQLHERNITTTLANLGCTAIESKTSGLVALRTDTADQIYPISVEVYEDEDAALSDPHRFRARVSRQFGLPVVYHHGATIDAALASVRWRLLDRPPISVPPLMAFA